MELRSVEELMDLLHACRGSWGAACLDGAPVDLHEHALQTAALLRRSRPADKELQVAGLVHVVGQLLPPTDPARHDGRARHTRHARHANRAAGAVGPLLGERVASLVRLPGETEDVLLLRQADESARTAGLDAGVLEDWRTVLELVSAGHARLGVVD